MSDYTVVLLRPRAFSTAGLPDAEEFGKDIYVAFVSADGADPYTKAIQAAQAEVYAADCADFGREVLDELGVSALDYELCVLFDGHQKPKLFGWQVPYGEQLPLRR